jgi:plasmid stabilization system protein ParE
MPRAADDAERIYRRVVQDARLQGQEWYNRLIGTLYSLETFPDRCEAIEGLTGQMGIVRRLLYGRKPHTYHIYFDIVGSTVRILHIRRGTRRVPERKDLF